MCVNMELISPIFQYTNFLNFITAENTVISTNFLVWKFCGKAQFWHSFGKMVKRTHLKNSLATADELFECV